MPVRDWRHRHCSQEMIVARPRIYDLQGQVGPDAGTEICLARAVEAR